MNKLDTDNEILLMATDGTRIRCLFGVRQDSVTGYSLQFLYEKETDNFVPLMVPTDVMSSNLEYMQMIKNSEFIPPTKLNPDEVMDSAFWEELIVTRFIDNVNDELPNILGRGTTVKGLPELMAYIRDHITVLDNKLVKR